MSAQRLRVQDHYSAVIYHLDITRSGSLIIHHQCRYSLNSGINRIKNEVGKLIEGILIANSFSAVSLGGYQSGNFWGLVLTAGPVVKFVLLMLLVFSITSWAIIFLKIIVVRKAGKESREFWKVFWRGEKMSIILAKSKRVKNSPLAKIFRAGYHELNKIRESNASSESMKSHPDEDCPLDNKIINNVDRALKRTCNLEIFRLEKGLIFLAITGSSAPFIGLFGTVWGIMNSFKMIGIRGSANLATVAPGIAEALIATAAGLAAAIPAVIFYNYLSKKVELFSSEMDNFSSEFLNMITVNSEINYK